MKLKLRQDLEFVKRTMQTETYWVVKDPVSFSHFLFTDRELELLKLFDGQSEESDIQHAWQNIFQTSALTQEQVTNFGNRLIRDNLVAVDEFGYGQLLFDNQQAKKTNWLKNLLMSPLAIRFRGVNPKPILDSLSWFGWVLFHPFVVILMMLFSTTVLIFALGNLDELAYRVPTITQFLSAQSITSLIISLSLIKIAHELGHAMACRRCGGDCFEIGVILLAFIPTLYCNVTDAWTFPERWKRLLVSFGGIYIEIILAAVAAVVWMLTGPSFLNAIMFNVVLLCSVNTVLINGNPLLRYDGYYLLSDFLEQPNLSEKSKRALEYLWMSWFRIPKRPKAFPSWLTSYSVLSFLYRWFVVGSIIVMVYVYLRSIGLRVAGQYVAIFLLGSLLARPLMSQKLKLRKSANSEWGRFSIARSAFPIAVACITLAVFFYLPLPSHVRCNLFVESKDPHVVYAPENGRLTYIKEEYEKVEPGTTIAKIESIEIDAQLREVRNKLELAKNNLEQLNLRVNENHLIASQIAVTQKNIDSGRQELDLLMEKKAKLTITAPLKGVIFPARIRNDSARSQKFAKWQGKPTDSANINCFVERGEELFSIENHDQKTVTLFVGEREIDFIKPGQSIKLLFTQHSNQLYDGVVGEIFEVDVDLNVDVVSDIGVETYQDSSGQIKSAQTPYRVIVIANAIPAQAFAGSGGRARITIPPQTLAQKTMDFLERLAKYEL